MMSARSELFSSAVEELASWKSRDVRAVVQTGKRF